MANDVIPALAVKELIAGTLKTEAFTFPTSDGTNNQVIITDGSGNLSWSSSASGEWTETSGVLSPSTASDIVKIESSATSGNTLLITRDLDSANTDDHVVEIINDNAGDDQDALRITQDGTGRGITLVANGASAAFVLDYNQDTSVATLLIQSPTGSNNDFAAYWNTSIDRYNIRLGNGTTSYYLWVDDSGNLRINSGAPTTENAGTVVGTQS